MVPPEVLVARTTCVSGMTNETLPPFSTRTSPAGEMVPPSSASACTTA